MPRLEGTLGRYCCSGAAVAVGALLAAPATGWAAPALFTYLPVAPLTGETVTFQATDTSAPGQTWDLDGDGACDDASGATAQRSFRVGGTYPVTLCDNAGGSSTSQRQPITVANRAPAAAFTFSPTAPVTDDAVTFTSTSTDAEGPIVSQTWDLDGDGQFDDAATPSAARPFPAPGAYSIGLRVVDADGAEHVARQPVGVAARPPSLLSPFPLVRLLGSVSQRYTRVRLLTVRAPARSRIEVRCRGRGCPPARRRARGVAASVRARSGAPVRFKRLERRLRPGAMLTVRVSGPGAIGKYTRFLIRANRPPARRDLCVTPAPKRLVRCP